MQMQNHHKIENNADLCRCVKKIQHCLAVSIYLPYNTEESDVCFMYLITGTVCVFKYYIYAYIDIF